MSSLTALSDALYRDEVTRARAMRPEDKLLEGPRLFDRACQLMADGIRHHHCELDEAEVRALLAGRFVPRSDTRGRVTADQALVAVLDPQHSRRPRD